MRLLHVSRTLCVLAMVLIGSVTPSRAAVPDGYPDGLRATVNGFPMTMSWRDVLVDFGGAGYQGWSQGHEFALVPASSPLFLARCEVWCRTPGVSAVGVDAGVLVDLSSEVAGQGVVFLDDTLTSESLSFDEVLGSPDLSAESAVTVFMDGMAVGLALAISLVPLLAFWFMFRAFMGAIAQN